MSIALAGHDNVVLDVHTVRDRAALVIDGQLIWLNRREIELLRHKLMLALRTIDFPAAVVPEPRSIP